MNPVIETYFDHVELYLLQTSAVVHYQLIRREIALSDGKLRLRTTLRDGSLLELFEYVGESAGQINVLKYSFHWQTAQGQLIRRWDNAPHYPMLPYAPHHIHVDKQPVESNPEVPSILSILKKIEQELKQNR